MTREYIEIYDGLDAYEVEAIIGRGYAGDYNRAPEPNTIEIIKIYSVDEDVFVDYNTEDGESLFLYAEHCIEMMLDEGEI
jgi:hypothetical protein